MHKPFTYTLNLVNDVNGTNSCALLALLHLELGAEFALVAQQVNNNFLVQMIISLARM